MQAFDVVLILLLVILVFAWPVVRASGAPWRRILFSMVAAEFVIHLFVEGIRWQMFPAYFVGTLLLALYAQRIWVGGSMLSKMTGQRAIRWAGYAIAGILLSSTVLLSYAFPVFNLPTPTGPYAIGTAELYVVDESRSENYTKNKDDKRALNLRIWYPAASTAGRDRATYWRSAAVRSAAVTKSTPLPWFTFTHLGRVATHSYWNAPISNNEPSYPIVIYSHGIGIGWASSNTKLAEGLASHGYIVVAIDHAYIGSISILPSGRVIEHAKEIAAAMSIPPPPQVNELQSKFRASRDWQEQVALYQKAMEIMPKEALDQVDIALSTQVADHHFVLDELTRLKRLGKSPLLKGFDLDRVGIIGMSLGGSAALETCSIDSRCRAGINLDGFHPRHIGLGLHDTPFLYLNNKENLLFYTNFHNSTAPAYSALIPGVTHFNFFDFSIMSPLYKRLGVLGSIDGMRALNITEDYSRWFFDFYLKGGPENTINELRRKYSEVEFMQKVGREMPPMPLQKKF